MIKKVFFLSLLFSICISQAQARVFNLAKEKFASYLFFNGSQPANLKDTPWVLESTSTSSDKTYSTVTGGEFGFTYATGFVSWRFAFEIFKPSKLSEISAIKNSAAIYTVSSDITGYAPKLGFEITPWMKDNYKIFAFGYIGTTSVTLKNDYTNVTIAPSANHTVEMAGTGNLLGGGIGYETSFFDTTSFIMEAGYRALTVDQLTYSKAVTTFNGAVTVGQTVLKTDGGKRSIDLSGAYATIGFRFWL